MCRVGKNDRVGKEGTTVNKEGAKVLGGEKKCRLGRAFHVQGRQERPGRQGRHDRPWKEGAFLSDLDDISGQVRLRRVAEWP